MVCTAAQLLQTSTATSSTQAHRAAYLIMVASSLFTPPYPTVIVSLLLFRK